MTISDPSAQRVTQLLEQITGGDELASDELLPLVYLADREIRLPDGTCLVLRGGFPINFDGARESLPSEQIQLTRGLLLSGPLQAVGCLRDDMAPGTEMLSPELQQLVLRNWRSSIGDGAISHPELESTTTIEELSGGRMRAPQCADLLLS